MGYFLLTVDRDFRYLGKTIGEWMKSAVAKEIEKKKAFLRARKRWFKRMDEHPILGDEFRRMKKMYAELLAKAPSSSREKEWFSMTYQEVYKPSRYGIDVLFRRFGQLKARLATEEHAMIDALLLPVSRHLKLNSQVVAEMNPVALLRLAFAEDGNGAISVQGQTDAITQFILTRLMLSVDEAESEVDAGETMAFALKWLLDVFFVPERSAKVYCAAKLGAERKPVMIRTSLEEMPILRGASFWSELWCRYIRCAGVVLWVALDDRIKTDFMSVLKMIRKMRLAHEEYDKHGVTFTVETAAQANLLAQEILAGLHRSGCSVVQLLIDQPIGGVLDITNPDTDPDFRARRFVFRIPRLDNAPVTVELNIQSLEEHLIATISHSTANHDWYAIKRFREIHFPWRYPQFVYGVRWQKSSKHWKSIAKWIRLRQEWKQ